MIVLVMKKKWFDMILSGGKKEEYREIKPYWTNRFRKVFPFDPFGERPMGCVEKEIIFRNGYRRNSPSFAAKCTLSIGAGKKEWGAEQGEQYYILSIKEIIHGLEEKEDEVNGSH